MPTYPGDPGHFDNSGYYNILNGTQLRQHCRRRRLSVRGLNEELRNRLNDQDAKDEYEYLGKQNV